MRRFAAVWTVYGTQCFLYIAYYTMCRDNNSMSNEFRNLQFILTSAFWNIMRFVIIRQLGHKFNVMEICKAACKKLPRIDIHIL